MPAAAQGLNFQDTTFRDSFEEAGIWISEVDGKWSDGFNWESGSPPADGQAVIIKVPTDVVVTIDSGPLLVSSIVSEELLLLNTTLTVNGPILNNGGLTISGTLINAYVLPSSTHDVGGGGAIIRNVRMGKTISSGLGLYNQLTVEDGLTLDDEIVVWGSSGSSFSGAWFNGNTPYTINGSGKILIGNGENWIKGNADLTIGPDITLHGYRGRFSAGAVLINDGTVHSDLPGELVFGTAGETVINNGTMKGTDGGNLGIDGNWTNNASITIQDGGTLNLGGTYNNLGTIVATDSTVRLGGAFTIAGLGGFSRTGGSVQITGTLDNGPGLTLDSTTGNWVIAGNSRIVGGVLDTLDGTSFSTAGRSNNFPVLDGVTINGTLSVSANSFIAVTNNLTLNGFVSLVGQSGSFFAALNFDALTPQLLNGTGTLRMSTGEATAVNAGDLTVGADITLEGATGRYKATRSFVIMGTVLPDISRSFVVESLNDTLINGGLFHTRSASTLVVRGLASNDGTFQIESGSLIKTERAGYTQSASGALIIDIRGLDTANHGQLTATEGVSLAGTLTVNVVDAYVPEIGDTFTIVTGTSITGTFDNVEGLAIGNDKQFQVNYNAMDVTLEVVAAP